MVLEPPRPLTILGVPIKGIIYVTTILIIVFLAIEPGDVDRLVERLTTQPPVSITGNSPPSRREPVDIIATPEMIERAVRQIQQEKRDKLETAETPLAGGRYFYIIELTSGGDLETTDLVIEPDRVFVRSKNGTIITIPSESISKISRLKLGESLP